MDTERILVIDDDARLVNLLSFNLGAEGFKVIPAYDGTEALSCLESTTPDLIICDIMLPDVDGYTLCQRVRERSALAAVPFIFLTAKNRREEKLRGLQTGADDYITKPFDLDELILRTRSLIRRTKAVKQVQTEVLSESIGQLHRLSSMGILAASIIHEIKGPVTAIKGYNDLLAIDLPEVRFVDYSHKIKQQVTQISQTIESMLEFARSQGTRRSCHSIESILSQALVLTGHHLSHYCNMKVDVQVNGPLPQVWVNAAQICQVFTNLIINAAQAVSGGRGRLEIRTDRWEEGVRVRFQDFGQGIAADHLERLFEPFFSTRQGQGGTGLGLYISKQILTSHGGTITVQSAPGCGACFTITLPPAPAVLPS